eukprot:Gb_40262 [translate_table: standard]
MPKIKGKPLAQEAIEALATEAKKDEELAYLPGRMYVNGFNDVAFIYSQQEKKGTNQDCMAIWEDFGSREDILFFVEFSTVMLHMDIW